MRRKARPGAGFALENPEPGTRYSYSEALINPARGKGAAPVQPRVIFALTRPDYELLCHLARARGRPAYLWDCAYRDGEWRGREMTLVAPAMGGPYAAMVLEKLIVLGAEMVLSLGWCGSLDPRVRIGSHIRPTRVQGADGTSPHYRREGMEICPDQRLASLLDGYLARRGVSWHRGAVVSLDAYFRQTPALVAGYREQGCLGVDLETAALLSVGSFRGLAVAALLVVSDELFDGQWRPGFNTPAFRRGREVAAQVALETAAGWQEAHE